MKNCLGKMERRRKRQGQSRITAGCFLAPSLCGVLLFQALPFLDVVRRSFLDAMGRSFVGMANYAAVWGNEAFRMAAKNTLYFFAAAVPALYLVSLALSLLVYRPGAGQRLFKTSLVLPMVLPAAAMALVWRILF